MTVVSFRLPSCCSRTWDFFWLSDVALYATCQRFNVRNIAKVTPSCTTCTAFWFCSVAFASTPVVLRSCFSSPRPLVCKVLRDDLDQNWKNSRLVRNNLWLFQYKFYEMGRLKGSTISTLKKYPELLPLWGCIIGGLALASLYTLRLATRNPDVAWRKETNPEPWQEYENKQYKFMNVAGEEPKTQAPKY